LDDQLHGSLKVYHSRFYPQPVDNSLLSVDNLIKKWTKQVGYPNLVGLGPSQNRSV
jgi:hypothetical protein